MDSEKKTILLTGGAGYIGSRLLPRLLAAGHQVHILDLFLFSSPGIYPPSFIEAGRLRVFEGDIRNENLVESALQGIDHVIHLAGVSNDPSGDLDPELTRSINIDGGKTLIELSRRAGVKRFINASSSSIYGIKEKPNVSEDTSLNPLTVYSESKVVIERYLKANSGSMETVTLRPATVCGFSPRMRLDLTVNILTYQAVHLGKITVFGGNQTRPCIHIDDMAEAYLKVLKAPGEAIDGKAFNVCSENYQLIEIAELVKSTLGKEIPIDVEYSEDYRSYHVSGKRIQEQLGFRPQKGVTDAIRDVANAFKNHLIDDPSEDRYYNVRVMKHLLETQGLPVRWDHTLENHAPSE